MMKTETLSASLLLVVLSLLSIQLLDDGWGFIQNLNLIIHEAGHLFFSATNEQFMIFMGSGLEFLVPVIFLGYFIYTNQTLGILFSGWWTGTALVHIGYYVSDAISQSLPLLGGKHVIHDWSYLLVSWGMIGYTDTIGSLIIYLGYFLIASSLFLILLIIIESHKKSKLPRTN